jgi:hypothetical protein
MEGNCEYIEYGQPARDDLAAWGLGRWLTTPYCKEIAYYEMLLRSLDLGR